MIIRNLLVCLAIIKLETNQQQSVSGGGDVSGKKFMTRCILLVMSGMIQLKLLIKCGVENRQFRGKCCIFVAVNKPRFCKV